MNDPQEEVEALRKQLDTALKDRDHARAWAYWHSIQEDGWLLANLDPMALDGWLGFDPPKPPDESTSTAGGE